jgi:hypothetical protein
VIVRDKDGNVLPQAVQPDAGWHESFRYFRLSQTTDDLFDAYRNAYLALESILSSIAPQHVNAAGRLSEGEGDWFLRALTQANQLVALSPFCPPSTIDPIQHLWDEFYRDMRSAMSHAKSGRPILLPQDDQQRRAVTESLQRLIRVYLALAESHLGLRRPGGGIFAVFFRRLTEPVLNAASAYATDDESEPNMADTVANPAGGVLYELVPIGPAVALAPFVVARTWFSPAQDVSRQMTSIRRIVAADCGDPLMAAITAAPLQLGSANRFEATLGFRGTNLRQPRDRSSF